MATTEQPKSRLQSMLQAAAQTVEWTYSLFWQLCPKQRYIYMCVCLLCVCVCFSIVNLKILFVCWSCWCWRILVWRDGYYNGAIKTRKTVQPTEVTTEEATLHRSQQLRELYESLSSAGAGNPARRPTTALSPEDLTESEWFYLMCVSFSFPPGVG